MFHYPHTPQHSPSSQECRAIVELQTIQITGGRSAYQGKQGSKLGTHSPRPQEEQVWSWPSVSRSPGLHVFLLLPKPGNVATNSFQFFQGSYSQKILRKDIDGSRVDHVVPSPPTLSQGGLSSEMKRRSVPRKMGARKQKLFTLFQ